MTREFVYTKPFLAIYIDILTKERLYLLFAYPKNVQEDLTSEQKKQLQMLIDAIKEE